nr:rhodanese-like domain-containing protein [Nodosilinea sp. LEGE 07088]
MGKERFKQRFSHERKRVKKAISLFTAGPVDGAVNLPLSELRNRPQALNPEQKIWVYCQVGQRAYYATRVLRSNGFNAYNLSDGFKTIRP